VRIDLPGRSGIPLALLVVVFAALPTIIAQAALPPFYVALLTEMLIMGIFSMGYDILMGYTGMISFGHAAYFGMGAYVTGMLMLHLQWPLLPAGMVGLLAAGLVAAIVGFFSIRLKSVYFALLTFAFAQLFYYVAVTWKPVTGGYDGFALSMPMSVSLPGLMDLNLRDRATTYYVVLVLVVVTFVFARRLMQSPFGKTLVAIRENELRATTLGYNVGRYKQAAFVVSGLLSGLAGLLFVPYQKFISPDLLFWQLGGLVIIMVLLGGKGTLWGPMVGAGVVVFLRDWLTAYTKHHLLLLGIIFLVVVLFAPNGLAGTLSRRWGFRRPRLTPPASTTAPS
jgi:branched-chain amino acid transport system permease protein